MGNGRIRIIHRHGCPGLGGAPGGHPSAKEPLGFQRRLLQNTGTTGPSRACPLTVRPNSIPPIPVPPPGWRVSAIRPIHQQKAPPDPGGALLLACTRPRLGLAAQVPDARRSGQGHDGYYQGDDAQGVAAGGAHGTSRSGGSGLSGFAGRAGRAGGASGALGTGGTLGTGRTGGSVVSVMSVFAFRDQQDRGGRRGHVRQEDPEVRPRPFRRGPSSCPRRP